MSKPPMQRLPQRANPGMDSRSLGGVPSDTNSGRMRGSQMQRVSPGVYQNARGQTFMPRRGVMPQQQQRFQRQQMPPPPAQPMPQQQAPWMGFQPQGPQLQPFGPSTAPQQNWFGNLGQQPLMQDQLGARVNQQNSSISTSTPLQYQQPMQQLGGPSIQGFDSAPSFSGPRQLLPANQFYNRG